MSNIEVASVCDGKYTFELSDDGRVFRCLRHGQAWIQNWHDVAGNRATLSAVSELIEARKEIAALNDQLAGLLPGTRYMDPPDGGSPTIVEQLRRMALDANRWHAFINCARIRLFGWAGLDSAGLPKPDNENRVHFGAEFWTSHRDRTEHRQEAPSVLTSFADAAIALQATGEKA